jgi:hypothetical protein
VSTQETASAEQVHAQSVTIIINGRPKVVEKERITFEEIVLLAFPNATFGPDIEYTITYTKGHYDNHEGTLTAGHSVKVKEGMIFNVTETNKS